MPVRSPVPRSDPWPRWVPQAVRHYIAHVEDGRSMRDLARESGLAASTVLRQIRRIEAGRDDPLIDNALSRLRMIQAPISPAEEILTMPAVSPSARHPRPTTAPAPALVEKEARRVLRRLCESGALLAVSAEMDKAVVLRQGTGVPTRIAVTPREVAQVFAINDWIICTKKGKIDQYEITAAGRAALRRLLARPADPGDGFAEQHRDWGQRVVLDDTGPHHVRCNFAESPLAALSRRKGKDGAPFLSGGLVAAGERLREDFELAQMGPQLAQNWDKFLTGPSHGRPGSGSGGLDGPSAARARVQAALGDLGPGLGDVALRVCCHLEGLEAAEKRMGWSARSGKIVLRIALQRLSQHYERSKAHPDHLRD